jgi:crotonobetainyl-CoA:carnitine CoA-transferase CaiB-like acyl-CoA transferase
MGEGVSFKYVGRPYRFTESPWDAFRAPLVGEHTKSILLVDLEYSAQDLKTLEVNGIISSNQN